MAGFRLTPPSPFNRALTCDLNGRWRPDPTFFKCQGDECPLPAVISRASIEQEGDNQLGDSVTVVCDPGFVIRTGVNRMRSMCQADRTWSIDLQDLACTSFRCSVPEVVLRATSRDVSAARSPGYNSIVEYNCVEGYWIGPGEFSRKVRCAEDGLWDPPINFTCIPVLCPEPAPKRNVRINTLDGNYGVGRTLMFQCTNYSWLAAQYLVTEWAFTGLLQTQVFCSNRGMWSPHPDSFACRAIHEGPFPTAYERGLNEQEVTQQMWLQDDNYISRELFKNPYFVIEPVVDLSIWEGGLSLARSQILEGSDALRDGEALYAWDGLLDTSWLPNFTITRQYNVTIYLGGLFIVQGVNVLPIRGQQISYRARFSANGVWFNNSVSTMSHPSSETPHIVSNFSYPAKFLQLIITPTIELGQLSITEIRIFLSPAYFELRFPIDTITYPTYLLIIIPCFIIALLCAHRYDRLDQYEYQFVPTSERTSFEDICYIIKLNLNKIKPVKYLLVRLTCSSWVSPVVLINSNFRSRRMVLVFPSECHKPPALVLTYLNRGKKMEKKEKGPVRASIKVGVQGKGDYLSARLPWLHSDTILLTSNKPNGSLLHDKAGESFKARLFDRLEDGSRLPWKIYQAMFDHLLLTIFFKDFMSQTTRTERLLLVFVGLLASLCTSLLLSFAAETLTCIGLGFLASLSGVVVVCLFTHLLLRQTALYGSKPPTDPFVEKYKLIQEIEAAKGRGDHVEKKEEFENDGARIASLLDLIEKSDIATFRRNLGLIPTRPADSLTDLLDPYLLPLDYRHPKPKTDFPYDLVSICSIDLQIAYAKRRARVRRRTRSAPALLSFYSQRDAVPARMEHYDYVRSKSSSSDDSFPSASSLPTIPTAVPDQLPAVADDYEVLSCASAWSRHSLVRPWHRVHTSLKEPIDEIFLGVNKQLKRQLIREFPWYDPAYRRIPSEYLISGYRVPEKIESFTDALNVQVRTQIGLKMDALSSSSDSSDSSISAVKAKSFRPMRTLYPFTPDKSKMLDRYRQRALGEPEIPTEWAVASKQLGVDRTLAELGKLHGFAARVVTMVPHRTKEAYQAAKRYWQRKKQERAQRQRELRKLKRAEKKTGEQFGSRRKSVTFSSRPFDARRRSVERTRRDSILRKPPATSSVVDRQSSALSRYRGRQPESLKDRIARRRPRSSIDQDEDEPDRDEWSGDQADGDVAEDEWASVDSESRQVQPEETEEDATFLPGSEYALQKGSTASLPREEYSEARFQEESYHYPQQQYSSAEMEAGRGYGEAGQDLIGYEEGPEGYGEQQFFGFDEGRLFAPQEEEELSLDSETELQRHSQLQQSRTYSPPDRTYDSQPYSQEDGRQIDQRSVGSGGTSSFVGFARRLSDEEVLSKGESSLGTSAKERPKLTTRESDELSISSEAEAKLIRDALANQQRLFDSQHRSAYGLPHAQRPTSKISLPRKQPSYSDGQVRRAKLTRERSRRSTLSSDSFAISRDKLTPEKLSDRPSSSTFSRDRQSPSKASKDYASQTRFARDRPSPTRFSSDRFSPSKFSGDSQNLSRFSADTNSTRSSRDRQSSTRYSEDQPSRTTLSKDYQSSTRFSRDRKSSSDRESPLSRDIKVGSRDRPGSATDSRHQPSTSTLIGVRSTHDRHASATSSDQTRQTSVPSRSTASSVAPVQSRQIGSETTDENENSTSASSGQNEFALNTVARQQLSRVSQLEEQTSFAAAQDSAAGFSGASYSQANFLEKAPSSQAHAQGVRSRSHAANLQGSKSSRANLEKTRSKPDAGWSAHVGVGRGLPTIPSVPSNQAYLDEAESSETSISRPSRPNFLITETSNIGSFEGEESAVNLDRGQSSLANFHGTSSSMRNVYGTRSNQTTMGNAASGFEPLWRASSFGTTDASSESTAVQQNRSRAHFASDSQFIEDEGEPLSADESELALDSDTDVAWEKSLRKQASRANAGEMKSMTTFLPEKETFLPDFQSDTTGRSGGASTDSQGQMDPLSLPSTSHSIPSGPHESFLDMSATDADEMLQSRSKEKYTPFPSVGPQHSACDENAAVFPSSGGMWSYLSNTNLRRDSLLTGTTEDYVDAIESVKDRYLPRLLKKEEKQSPEDDDEDVYYNIEDEAVIAPKTAVPEQAGIPVSDDTFSTPVLSSTTFTVGEVPLLISCPAASLYNVSTRRLRLIQVLVLLSIGLLVVLSLLAIRTIESASAISCLLQHTTWAFLAVGLFLEAILRQLLFRRKEKLRLDQLYCGQPKKKTAKLH